MAAIVARFPSASEQRAEAEKRKKRDYSVGEEVFNAVTHGVGALLAIATIPLCVVRAVNHGAGIVLAAALIYSITMVIEYLMSTLYHAIAAPRAKKVFRILDHCGIYLYIAGCYTPFCLLTLIDSNGIPLCAFVWAVAIAGIIAEAFWVGRPRWISAVLYLLQGWAVAVCIPALWMLLDPVGFWLLVIGGVCYTIGAVFYVFTKKKRFMHSVFHIWVLAGSIFQFFAIFLFVL